MLINESSEIHFEARLTHDDSRIFTLHNVLLPCSNLLSIEWPFPTYDLDPLRSIHAAEKKTTGQRKLFACLKTSLSGIMSVGSQGSTVTGDRPISADPRFNNAVHNITRLFDRISAIEDELTQSQNVLSDRVHDEIWSETSNHREPVIDRKAATTMLPPKSQCQVRSKSVPDTLFSSKKIDSFQASDEIERRRFIELELERQRDRFVPRGNVRNSLGPCLQQISERGRFSEVKAELTVAREEAKNLTRVNAELRKRYNVLASERDACESKFEKLRRRHSVLRSENARLSDSLKAVSHQHSQEAVSARETVRQADARHAGTRAELWAANQEITNLKQENEKLKIDLDLSRTENHSLRERVKVLESEKQTLMNDLQTIENRVICIEKHHSGVNERLASTRADGDTVLLQLVEQLSQAREDAVTARSEANKYMTELEEFRKQSISALHRERLMRKKAIESECLSLLSHTMQHEPVRESENRNERTYLKRIRTLQDTVNALNERIADFERKELSRAPVILRSRSAPRKARKPQTGLPQITRGYPQVLQSFLCEDEEERPGPVPTETDNTEELTSN
jgi:hypothetical protein